MSLFANEGVLEAAELAGGADAGSPELPLILGLTVFVLAIFVGYLIITKIPPTLHTPLMSGSNAISGITVVGALIAAGAAGSGQGFVASVLGLFAVVLATINVVGGFLVTNRMLEMFRRKK
jgi:NAD(P) transhydrogenase subunit alpha